MWGTCKRHLSYGNPAKVVKLMWMLKPHCLALAKGFSGSEVVVTKGLR